MLRISGWPAEYYNAYFFAEFVHGKINYGKWNNGVFTVTEFHNGLGDITSMQQDDRGGIWMTTHPIGGSGVRQATPPPPPPRPRPPPPLSRTHTNPPIVSRLALLSLH